MTASTGLLLVYRGLLPGMVCMHFQGVSMPASYTLCVHGGMHEFWEGMHSPVQVVLILQNELTETYDPGTWAVCPWLLLPRLYLKRRSVQRHTQPPGKVGTAFARTYICTLLDRIVQKTSV